MPENNYQHICDVDQISPGQSRAFSITDERGSKIEIALFNAGGKFYAISNLCAHQRLAGPAGGRPPT